MGKEARDVLRAEGYGVEWHDYPMQHEVGAEELAEIDWRWLLGVVAASERRPGTVDSSPGA